LLCFCFECEHVGPRVMPGHRESDIRGQFHSNSAQRRLALRGHRQFDNVSALSAITALAPRSSHSALRFCIFVAACRSGGASARQTAILKAHSILFLACTSSGGKPLGGGSFTFTYAIYRHAQGSPGDIQARIGCGAQCHFLGNVHRISGVVNRKCVPTGETDRRCAASC
jgi:hypothetical protein